MFLVYLYRLYGNWFIVCHIKIICIFKKRLVNGLTFFLLNDKNVCFYKVLSIRDYTASYFLKFQYGFSTGFYPLFF